MAYKRIVPTLDDKWLCGAVVETVCTMQDGHAFESSSDCGMVVKTLCMMQDGRHELETTREI